MLSSSPDIAMLSDQFRSYVDEKITRLEKLDDRVIRVEVEVSAERNKRQHDQASRVEITASHQGPGNTSGGRGRGQIWRHSISRWTS